MRKVLTLALGVSLLLPVIPAFAEEAAVIESLESTATTTPETLATTTPEFAAGTTPEAAPATPSTPQETVEVIVKYEGEEDITVIATSTSISAEAVAAKFEQDPNVEYAEPNYPRTFDAIVSTDSYLDLLWALQNTGQSVNGTIGAAGSDIEAEAAWQLSLGTSTIVAVIDNGVLYTHPDLASNMWDGTNCVSDTGATLGNCTHGYDYLDDDTSPLPEVPFVVQADHGTHVAGIIASTMNNATGTVGIAPGAKIMALRFNLDVASEIRAIDFAIQNGAKIINASYSGTQYSQAEYDAIARFRDAGGIFVAAAGNSSASNDAAPRYPASYDLSNIVSVAATDQSDALAWFSNYGATTVDIGAPGTNIMSTITTTGTDASYGYKGGTSMAAPYVAGTLALGHAFSTNIATLKAALLSGGDSVPDLAGKSVSGKRLNAFGFLSALTATSTSTTTPDTTAPVITLIGAAEVSLRAGTTYVEEGATATDDQDGTVTVEIGGTVDTSNVGTYTRTYNAVDAAGNRATQVTRTVNVTSNSTSSRGGGGGGGGGSRANAPTANPPRNLLSGTATTRAFTQILSTGTQGSEVTALQQLLGRLGYFSTAATGYYGPVTASAVRAYQSARGLPMTGITDEATNTALSKEASPAPASTSLQAQIQMLLAQIAVLQALLKAQGG